MTHLLPRMLSVLALLSAGCGAPQTTGSKAVDGEASVANGPCPAGSARVERAGERTLVTVADAFAEARDGDRIGLCPGRALHGRPLILSNVNDVIISGDTTSLVASGDFPVVQLKGCTQVVLEGVHVVHEVGEWCAHGCVEIYDSSQMTVRNSELDGSGYFGIVTSSVSDSEFRSNLFHNCHYGFSAWSSSGLTLVANTFRDNRGANLEIPGDPKLRAGVSFTNDIQADNAFGPVRPATAPPGEGR